MNNISPYCKTKNNILANICDSPFLKDNSTYLKDEKLNIYELILSTLNKYKLNHIINEIGNSLSDDIDPNKVFTDIINNYQDSIPLQFNFYKNQLIDIENKDWIEKFS